MSAEAVRARESDRWHAPCRTSRRAPRSEVGFRPDAAAFAAERPAEPLGEVEGGCIRKSAVAIPLKRYALSSSELRKLGDREDQHLAVLAHDRNGICVRRNRPDHASEAAYPGGVPPSRPLI